MEIHKKFKSDIKECDTKINKQYDCIYKKYKSLSLDALKKEKTLISAKISADDWKMKRAGPNQIYSLIAVNLSLASICISLMNIFKGTEKLLFYILILLIIVSSIKDLKSCKRYDYIEPIYLENKLRLDIINQVIEDRMNCKKVKVQVYRYCRK